MMKRGDGEWANSKQDKYGVRYRKSTNAWELDPACRASQEERIRAVRAAVKRLPRGERDVVALWMHGHTHAEIAKYLGIKERTSGQLLYHAKKRLRNDKELSRCAMRN